MSLCVLGGFKRTRPTTGLDTGRVLWTGRSADLIRSALLLVACSSCLQRPTSNPNVLVVAIPSGPNNLDPRVGLDDASQKIHALIFDSLFDLDNNMRVTPKLADRLEHPTPTTYIVTMKRGVRFQDGHELTSADVVYTYRSFLDPAFVSGRKGGYREVHSIDAIDRYTVVFTLDKPFTSFPINLVMPIVPDGAGAALARHPVGTGPYRFVRYAVDDQIELEPFADYFGGRPRNDGLVFKVVPDDIMRGLELRKGTTDIVVNDLTPDIAYQLEKSDRLQMVESPGVDYQYLGLNLQDPVLKDVRVRQALAYAIDTHAIIEYLRRGLGAPATGLLPNQSWASAPDLRPYPHDPDRARALLDEAGYRDPDGDGPAPRLRLSLKISSSQEFNRLQAAVIQQNLREVGIDLDVRTYELATLFSDVLKGNFQLYVLQWTAGSLADPDMLRRVFHSKQVPPEGFNRGHFSDPRVDALLDEASSSTDEAHRLELFQQVQRLLAVELPYISLWNKTNFIVAQQSLTGVRVSTLGDLVFLKDVARVGR
jgi:peptide/nickel transport system substrate-binding protein